MDVLMHNQALLLLAVLVVLVLAGRLFAASRLGWRGIVQTLFGWAVIGVIAVLVLGHRDEIGGLIARISERFDEQQVVAGETVRIPMSRDGHFWAKVRLNGVELRMLVDSGATITALSEASARKAGVKTGLGLPVIIETANGAIQARTGTVGRVEVGPLATRNLEVVVAPNFGEFDVLGMNFLSRLKSWRVERKTLVLEPSSDDKTAAGKRSEDGEAHTAPKRQP
jgi:aspartyl protease family protein